MGGTTLATRGLNIPAHDSVVVSPVTPPAQGVQTIHYKRGGENGESVALIDLAYTGGDLSSVYNYDGKFSIVVNTEAVTPGVNTFSLITANPSPVDAVIYWGDGNYEVTTLEARGTSSPLLTNHTYSTPGTYTIQIYNARGLRFYYNNNAEGDKIIALGATPGNFSFATNLARAWLGSVNLTAIDSGMNLSGVTDFSYAWQNCTSLTSFPVLDTSSGTVFSYAWSGCTGLTSFPVLDTSSGISFNLAWYNCTSLTSFPVLDTSSGTNLSNAWQNCTSLTSFPVLDTSSGTNLSSAWSGCSGLTSFPALDTSSGSNFSATWQNCTSLTSFPALDTSSGSGFDSTWSGCSGLTSFPVLNISKGTSFSSAWSGCTSLTSFPAGFFDSWAPTVVSSGCFLNTWANCTSLTATSVENILNSIDFSGRNSPSTSKNITISYNASSGTPNISTAVTNLKARGWVITLNGVTQ